MEFTNEFTIPLGIEEALDVLTDLERVAPCMPGATLETVDGDTYTGRVKVKVGPMALTYSGDATVTEIDRDAHTARIEASGREKRGSGTAEADVAATLEETDGGTKVVVTTDINITGKPAQFGRGVMADVGGKIIDRFADNLREQLDEEQARSVAAADADVEVEEPPADDPSDEAAVAATPVSAPTGPRAVAHRPPRDEALDLMDVAGDATAKRLVPVAIAAALVLLVVLLRRRGDGDDGE